MNIVFVFIRARNKRVYDYFLRPPPLILLTEGMIWRKTKYIVLRYGFLWWFPCGRFILLYVNFFIFNYFWYIIWNYWVGIKNGGTYFWVFLNKPGKQWQHQKNSKLSLSLFSLMNRNIPKWLTILFPNSREQRNLFFIDIENINY